MFFLIWKNIEVKLVNTVIGLVGDYVQLKENINWFCFFHSHIFSLYYLLILKLEKNITNAPEVLPQIIKLNYVFVLDDY